MTNERENEKRSLVFEGMVSVRALLEAGAGAKNDREIKAVLCTDERRKKNPREYLWLCHRAEERGFEVRICEKEELESLASGRSHGGIVALCGERTFLPLEHLSPVEKGFYVMMEGIEDPFNFGYALRSLYAAGVDGVILSGRVRTGADGTVCRSSAGASERMPICNADPETALGFFSAHGYKTVCADLPDSVPMYEGDLSRPLFLIVGGEKRGITGKIRAACDEVVRIDYGRPFDEALSAASAASVLAFEVYRQNRGAFDSTAKKL